MVAPQHFDMLLDGPLFLFEWYFVDEKSIEGMHMLMTSLVILYIERDHLYIQKMPCPKT